MKGRNPLSVKADSPLRPFSMSRRQTLTQYLDARVEQVIGQNMPRWATLMPNTKTYFVQPFYQPIDRPTPTATPFNHYIVDVLPIDAYPVR